jgi:hypothetical protein
MPNNDMDIKSPDVLPNHTSNPKSTEETLQPVWNNDTGITKLSDKIFTKLLEKQAKAKEAGDLDENAPSYGKPVMIMNSTKQISQRICFNLICHRGTVSDIPAIKVFKSFMSTLRNAECFLTKQQNNTTPH